MRVLVCGAGVAGPTLAFWLERFGFEPTLIERTPALRTGGYIIDVWGLGFDIAEKMGLLPALRETGYTINEVRLVDGRGRRRGGFGPHLFEAILGDRYLSVVRSDLAKLIYEALGSNVRTIFGDSVIAVDDHGDGVDVTFAHSKPERFDIVIGAGGLHSPIRALVFGPEKRFERYLGYCAAAFTIDGYRHRDAHAYVGHAAPGRQVMRCALRDNRTVAFLVFSATVPSRALHETAEQKKILRDSFGQDGWEVPELLAGLERCTDLYFDAVSQIRMDSWSRGRVALVGDACFCPSLLAGQGAALAMAGAYILAGELKVADGDYRSAFASYEALFHPFVAKKQRAAAWFAGSFAPRTRFGILLRNEVTRVMAAPFLADWFMGGLLRDRLVLPSYER